MLEVYDEVVEGYGLDERGQRDLAGLLLLKVGAGCSDKATLLQLATPSLALSCEQLARPNPAS